MAVENLNKGEFKLLRKLSKAPKSKYPDHYLKSLPVNSKEIFSSENLLKEKLVDFSRFPTKNLELRLTKRGKFWYKRHKANHLQDSNNPLTKLYGIIYSSFCVD
ncbi:hypothetical protein BMS3Abin17_00293 [archaeon BMS3Abin17]|nr:hypothetical protein BMS3Abin17_00293 [archaeon BMS3Abin17]